MPIDLDRSDAAIASSLWDIVGEIQGLSLVISEASWLRGGPIPITPEFVDELVATHAALHEEPLFGGDVLIIDVFGQRRGAVHHDGIYTST